jgi:hypothetical protein
MFRFETFEEHASGTGRQTARVFTVIRRQPSWIARVAFTVAALTIVAVLAVIVLPAVVLATIVFVALALALRAWAWCRGLFGIDRAGRRNVRIVVRD